MREILFKAKSLKTNRWIIGSCVKYNDEHVFILPMHEQASTLTFTQLFSLNAVKVDPETVCQYTGAVDKTGTKIFERDILEIAERDFEGKWNVKWDDLKGRYEINLLGTVIYASLKARDMAKVKVIGNIHDKEEKENE